MIRIPSVFQFLFEPWRYKVARGGRGAGKSRSFAQALLVLGAKNQMRILCAREIQKSINDSVHYLLKSQIEELGLSSFYTVLSNEIRGKNGTTFIFAGLKHNISNIKSLEAVDVVWCFLAGTMIDGKNIEDIKIGDYVNSYNHKKSKIEKRMVSNVFKSKTPKHVYKLLTQCGGKYIIGTAEHPVFVKCEGYVPLSKVKPNSIIYAKEIESTRALSLSRRMWNKHTNRFSWSKTVFCQKWWDKLQGLFKKKIFRKNEDVQSYVQSRFCRKFKAFTIRITSAYLVQKRCWERQRIYRGTRSIIESFRERMVERISRNNRQGLPYCKQNPNKLQVRLGKCLLQVGNRMRWWFSSWFNKSRGGQEKEYLLKEYRVDSVTLQKQADIKQLGLSDEGDYVYNIEVEVNNNYFANDILVHNCEEAEAVSANSWDTLIPTIRKDGSEIWISYNPDIEESETHQRFAVNPPPEYIVENGEKKPYCKTIKVNYVDNPFFPKELERERIQLLAKDPIKYDNVWLGNPKQSVEGAVFMHEMQAVVDSGRIRPVLYDKNYPVDVFYDLGRADQTALWFVQFIGNEYRIIRYYDNNRQHFSHYIQYCKELNYTYGTHYLPHDAESEQLAAQFTIKQQAINAGFKVIIIPRIPQKNLAIEAARSIFDRCVFDSTLCKDGLTCLRKYAYIENSYGGFSKEPKHDENSNGADAFLAIGQSRIEQKPRSVTKKTHRSIYVS